MAKNAKSNKKGSKQNENVYGIDNLTYNIVTLLHEKAKGLEAFDTYIEDADDHEEVRELLEDLRDQQREHVQQLQECLQMLLSGESSEYEDEEEAA